MMKAFFVFAILIVPVLALAQQKDSLIIKDTTGKIVAKTIKNDTTAKPVAKTPVKHSTFWKDYDSTGQRIWIPRKASIYSAVLPGLGQAYNRKYWKVPIAWTAVGIPIALFFDNKKWYDRTRYAIAVLANGSVASDSIFKVNSALLPFVEGGKLPSLLNYRNEFRKDMDYSILFTLLFWGLNVVDATVDAHLKGFNVSDNLSMQIKPAILSNQSVGISIVFKVADNHSKTIPSRHVTNLKE